MALDLELQGPGEARARRDRPGDQRLRPDHRQAADVVRQAQGRRHDHRRATGSTPARYPEAGNLQAPQRRPGPGEERPDRHGLLPRLGVELAAQPARHVQPRVGRPRRQALGSRAGPASQWDAAQKKWIGDVPDYPPTMDPRRPEGVGAVHHERRGRRPALLELDARTGRSPSTTSRSSRRSRTRCIPSQSAVAGGVPLRQGGRADEPLRHRRGVPVRRDQLPADRARALRHPARAAPGRAPARGRSSRCPRSWREEKGIQNGDRVRVSLQAGQARGARRVVTKRLGAAEGRRARRSTRSASRSTGASSASPPTGTRPRAPLARQRADAVRRRRQLRTPEFKAFLVNIEKI